MSLAFPFAALQACKATRESQDCAQLRSRGVARGVGGVHCINPTTATRDLVLAAPLLDADRSQPPAWASLARPGDLVFDHDVEALMDETLRFYGSCDFLDGKVWVSLAEFVWDRQIQRNTKNKREEEGVTMRCFHRSGSFRLSR